MLAELRKNAGERNKITKEIKDTLEATKIEWTSLKILSGHRRQTWGNNTKQSRKEQRYNNDYREYDRIGWQTIECF